MANEDANEAEWRKNLKGKSEEIRQSILAALSRISTVSPNNQDFQRACTTLAEQAASMQQLYTTNSRPPILAEIKSNAEGWPRRHTDPNIAISMVQAYANMAQLGESKSLKKSFNSIFSEHAKDQEFNDYLKELCAQLRRLLEEGEDVIASSMAKELREILEEIETQQGKSLVDIDPWLEFLISNLGVIGVAVMNSNPLLAITANALVLTLRTRKRLYKLYGEAREALITDRQFKHSARIAIDISHISDFERIENVDQAIELLKQRSNTPKPLSSGSETSPPENSKP